MAVITQMAAATARDVDLLRPLSAPGPVPPDLRRLASLIVYDRAAAHLLDTGDRPEGRRTTFLGELLPAYCGVVAAHEGFGQPHLRSLRCDALPSGEGWWRAFEGERSTPNPGEATPMPSLNPSLAAADPASGESAVVDHIAAALVDANEEIYRFGHDAEHPGLRDARERFNEARARRGLLAQSSDPINQAAQRRVVMTEMYPAICAELAAWPGFVLPDPPPLRCDELPVSGDWWRRFVHHWDHPHPRVATVAPMGTIARPPIVDWPDAAAPSEARPGFQWCRDGRHYVEAPARGTCRQAGFSSVK